MLPCGWLPLDVDTFVMKKRGHSPGRRGPNLLYAGVDGFCPLAVYLGSHELRLDLALHPGVQHSALETEFNFERVMIPMAQCLERGRPESANPARLDSGFDSTH